MLYFFHFLYSTTTYMNIAHLYISVRDEYSRILLYCCFDLHQNVPRIFCTFCYIVVVFVYVGNLFTFYFHLVVCNLFLSALHSLAILCFPVLLFYILISLIVLALSNFRTLLCLYLLSFLHFAVTLVQDLFFLFGILEELLTNACWCICAIDLDFSTLILTFLYYNFGSHY